MKEQLLKEFKEKFGSEGDIRSFLTDLQGTAQSPAHAKSIHNTRSTPKGSVFHFIACRSAP